jgi:zinc/manganese transport system substrate-binding protein
MRTILSFFIGSVLLSGAVLAGCGGEADPPSSGAGGSGRQVVAITASTTQLGDFARQVGGEDAAVTQILSANSDPHDYEPTPSDAESIADADLVLRSGGDVDEWLDQVIDSSGSDAPVLTVIDSIDTRDLDGEVDPHWWQNPENAVIAVRQIRDELDRIAPDDAGDVDANADAYIAELTDLDAAVEKCIDRVPPNRRKLVTSHDALGYYADRYGIDVIGAAIPALSTQAQASAGETADLIDLIRRTGVTTIFAEAGVSQQLEQTIAAEAGATVGGELYADTLGPEGSDGATYIEAIEANTAELVDGFTDGEQRCRIDLG